MELFFKVGSVFNVQIAQLRLKLKSENGVNERHAKLGSASHETRFQ